MIALDTNVVVRTLVADDPAQASRARELLESEVVFVSKSVILESEWVLRSAYGISESEIRAGFRKLIALPDVIVEDREQVVAALSLHERGFDFADALHLASCREAKSFRTFDKRLLRRARREKVRPPVEDVG